MNDFEDKFWRSMVERDGPVKAIDCLRGRVLMDEADGAKPEKLYRWHNAALAFAIFRALAKKSRADA